MPAVPPPAIVLVTGASGFLGAHVCRTFLARGYQVRGTVRSPPKGDYLRNLFEAEFPGAFTYVIVKDISEPGAFDEAVKGVDAIAHTASPLELVSDDTDPDVLIKPAVGGTIGVLKSAKEHGPTVRRIIVTSSVSALDEPRDPPYEYTTANWNTKSIEEVRTKGKGANAYLKYCASKTLAEKALWDFIEENKGSINFDGVATNTPWLYGPIIHEVASFDKINHSTTRVWKMLSDPLPANEEELADWAGDHLDVRDLATATVDGIAREELGGRRLLMACGPVTRQDFLDVAHILEPAIPKLPFEVPRGKPGYGDSRRNRFFTFSSEETRKLLGYDFRKLSEQVKDTLLSINERGFY
ncbi:NAD(P)-binding protein [Auriculariales sp. MPI-PUGE-AT-0066]|nr:NAD(P)-binding protein [Auriculariales sp. MPI-PUGE-AT-0066]